MPCNFCPLKKFPLFNGIKSHANCSTDLETRGGVLEDVLGLEDVLEDTFSSPWPWPWPRRSSPWPWPWPRSLKSSKIALSSARGQHYFLNSCNFVGKRQKHCRKFASTFFVFLTWSKVVAKGRGLGSAPPFPIEISPMTKLR